jgi:hypothetical protein
MKIILHRGDRDECIRQSSTCRLDAHEADVQQADVEPAWSARLTPHVRAGGWPDRLAHPPDRHATRKEDPLTYPTADSRQLSILLRISRELDVVGDVTATVDQPSDVLAWATVLPEPTIGAWRAEDSGNRYVQVTAPHHRDPIHGRVTAVLPCEAHREFWDELLPKDLEPGQEQVLSLHELGSAWTAMPLRPPE